MTEQRARVVVVGGGVAGLTAAYTLGEHYDVVLLEASPRLGGKLYGAEVGGVRVDVGAEAMLHARPEGSALARELGLPLVHPTPAGSRLWTRGALRSLPRSMMGVPMDLDGLVASDVLSDRGIARVRAEPMLPPMEVDGDISVGDLVGARLGDEVVDRLVEPLLGGVYAGHAREISARAATPQLLAMLDRGSLLEAAAAMPARSTGPHGEPTPPVFAGIDGGMTGLVDGIAAAARRRGVQVRTGTTARELRRTEGGYRVTTGAATTTPAAPEAGGVIDADAVVLATPAAASSRLLAGIAPTASARLAEIEYASMAVVTLAFAAADLAVLHGLPGVGPRGASGFLVPPVDGRTIKASTFSFAKWDWVREAGSTTADGPLLHLRTSIGRHREEAVLQRGDEELVDASLADLAEATGLRARPVDTHVQRWGGGLPQYAVGHVDRVAAVRDEVEQLPALALCGAAYDGVGIPACIGSARVAAEHIWETLPEPGH